MAQVTITRTATTAGQIAVDVVPIPGGLTAQEFILSIRKGGGYTDANNNWHPVEAVIQIQPS